MLKFGKSPRSLRQGSSDPSTLVLGSDYEFGLSRSSISSDDDWSLNSDVRGHGPIDVDTCRKYKKSTKFLFIDLRLLRVLLNSGGDIEILIKKALLALFINL